MNQRAQTVLAERYVLQAKLGEGGMGTVYRAQDTRLDAPVVVKMPHAALLSDKEFAERFSREARSLVQLRHPHVVPILDVGEYRRVPFVVMQYLGGGSLDDRIKSAPQQRLVWPSLKDWLPVISDALDFIHRMGYVHRDVKPANILFDEHGKAFLSDFGIAKALAASEKPGGRSGLTGTGMVVGTAEYMAPEIILGERYDGRSDQYSLAIAVFEVLAGQRPFFGPTPSAVLVQHISNIALNLHRLNPNIPVWLADAVQRALAKKPGERFATCRDFGTAVFEQPPEGAPADQRTQTIVPQDQKTQILSFPSTDSSSTVPSPTPNLPGSPQALVDTGKLVVTAKSDQIPYSAHNSARLPKRVWLMSGVAAGLLVIAVALVVITSAKSPVINKQPTVSATAPSTPHQDSVSAFTSAEALPLPNGTVFLNLHKPEGVSFVTLTPYFVGQTFKAPSGRLKEVTLELQPLIGSVDDMRLRVLVCDMAGTWPKVKPIYPPLFESTVLTIPKDAKRRFVTVGLSGLNLKQGDTYCLLLDGFSDRVVDSGGHVAFRTDNPYPDGRMIWSGDVPGADRAEKFFVRDWGYELGYDMAMRLTIEP